MIDEKRLLKQFIELVEIDSPSRKEGKILCYIRGVLEGMGLEVHEDDAASATCGDAGNIMAKIPATVQDVPSILLNAHMDTVSKGEGVKALVEDGFVRSVGNTILGGDDKSGIAIILETVRALKEDGEGHGPLEILFTVSEEIGLLGAKHFDVSRIESGFGYALDSSLTGCLIHAAPASNHFKATFYGREAHAGLVPEEGASAIEMASRAIAGMTLGRIDYETTANIGKIEGGRATNIVPGLAVIEGEARSHSPEKLAKQTEAMEAAARKAVMAFEDKGAKVDVEINQDFPALSLDRKSRVVSLAEKAAKKAGFSLELKAAGGGSDANIFNGKGIDVAILGTGMSKVHTSEEEIKISDMTDCARLLFEIIKENRRA